MDGTCNAGTSVPVQHHDPRHARELDSSPADRRWKAGRRADAQSQDHPCLYRCLLCSHAVDDADPGDILVHRRQPREQQSRGDLVSPERSVLLGRSLVLPGWRVVGRGSRGRRERGHRCPAVDRHRRFREPHDRLGDVGLSITDPALLPRLFGWFVDLARRRVRRRGEQPCAVRGDLRR